MARSLSISGNNPNFVRTNSFSPILDAPVIPETVENQDEETETVKSYS